MRFSSSGRLLFLLSSLLIICALVLKLSDNLLLAAKGLAAASLTPPTATTPIQHVVIIMQENHTFNSLFGTFPGATGVTEPEAPNPLPYDFDHSGPATITAIDSGKMDQFPSRSLIQYTQADIPTYWAYAKQFGLGDNFFSSMATSSTPNHISMIAAQSGGLDSTGSEKGCNSPANYISYSRSTAGSNYWAYPCYSMQNLPQLLDANGLTWKYYSSAAIFDGALNVRSLVNSPDIITNSNQFVKDVQSGNMAAVTWLTPPPGDPSDHPPNPLQGSENFIATQINAVMNSPYWSSTAIFVTWDEWGGFYDPVAPPTLDGDGLGLRVPLLVISPYAKAGYISHEQGEFSSFPKFIEENWNLPNLGQRDALSQTGDLMDFFDFTQMPQPPLIEPMLSYSQALKVPASGAGNVPRSIQPPVGGVGTTYTYNIVYMLSGSPAVHNVTIDGVNHSMSPHGPFQGGGILYSYSTTLPVGNHHYTFNFSDTSGTVTLPFNGVPFPGPEVHAFNVTHIALKPTVTLPGTTMKFSAKYQSPTNTPPTVTEIDIDGASFQLLPPGGSLNYKNGVVYSYSTSSLSIGVHYTRFKFDDGSAVAIFEGATSPTVTPVLLSKSSVSPTTGTSSTRFTFSTTYQETSGAAPTSALLYVDTTAYPMTFISGNYTTGALFQVSTTLPGGKHTYSFVFSDASSSWADPFAPAVYAGPNVGVRAQQVAPGTILFPTDTDQD